jgi:hypothetical protein
MANTKRNENSTLIRTVLISSIILAGLFTLAYFLEDNIGKIFGRFSDEAAIGIMLFSLWLVVSSTVRSLNRLEKRMSSIKLLVGGVATAAFGTGLFIAFLYFFPNVNKAENVWEVGGASGEMALVMAGLAFFISVLTVVNTRIGSKLLVNLIEVLLVGGAIAGFIWYVTK